MKREALHNGREKHAPRKRAPDSRVYGRSALTTGSTLLPGVKDNRSTWARRFRDLIELHTEDRGGFDMCSEAEKALIRRASTLIVELERMEVAFASNGGGKGYELDRYQRMTNTLRRVLETLGIERRAKTVNSDTARVVNDILAEHGRER
ncbi:hypothetical protein HW532_15015 [Kaustia mangrovi]|uniref:Uncharacterized protein n=1 Tax=Kaustia mangrovi TaxID=2593653 RepID=A0A7S8C5R3_9HYPH|nr:hypothetical protein [Kaustia mangrovi]QPC43883.1 hypothetical protein HW532_15015 [Kaustia mangrovi]